MNFLRLLLAAMFVIAFQQDAVAQVPLGIKICCGTVNSQDESVPFHFSLTSSIKKGDMGFTYTYEFINHSTSDLKLLPLSFTKGGGVLFIGGVINSINNPPEHLRSLDKIFITLRGGETKTLVIEDDAPAIELPVSLAIINDDESSAAQPYTYIWFPRLPMFFGR